MHHVAHHLQVHALSVTGNERDSYARSAFNRYYYAVFLSIRNMFRLIDPSWSRTPHSTYPQILKGSILSSLKKAEKTAHRTGDSNLLNDIQRAKRAVYELARIITDANSVRKVADYEPEEPVSFIAGGRFSLRSISITDAHTWEPQSATLTSDVISVWRQIHG